MKLILGTAQLGLKYGISNSTGIPDPKQLNSLFSICKINGIEYCDTALNYGNSHQALRNRGMKIITKLNLGGNYISDLLKIFNDFNTKELNTILVHNCNVLLQKPDYWGKLEEFQKEKNFKLGVSVYNTEQVDQLLSHKIIPSVLQIPYNLFDQKFNDLLPRLKELNIEIHARSVFLQGLFFLKTNDIPVKLRPLVGPLKLFNNFCDNNLNEKVKNALHFVLHNKMIDKLIVGVEKPNQLLELVKCYNSYNGEIPIFKYRFNNIQKSLLKPINW